MHWSYHDPKNCYLFTKVIINISLLVVVTHAELVLKKYAHREIIIFKPGISIGIYKEHKLSL
ncbi:hypothetical protein C0J52_09539 [Blattella germanica]|nr:hypothetical protein C0J52_09539 [Blattella germanica]